MNYIIAAVVVLAVITIGYLAYRSTADGSGPNSGPPGPSPYIPATSVLSQPKFGTWISDKWDQNNVPYTPVSNKAASYKDCRDGCESDPNCKTMLAFQDTSGPRPCSYYSTEIPQGEIYQAGGSWEGTVDYRF